MVSNGCKDSAVLCKSHQFSFISIAACVLVLICPDIGSAPRWTCLTWPGCGSRLRSEGRTPETLSPETCCGSMTPFSWNTRVIHKSYSFNCSTANQHYYDWVANVCVCESDGESRLGFSEVPKQEDVGVSSRRRRDYRDPYHQFNSQRSTVQDG